MGQLKEEVNNGARANQPKLPEQLPVALELAPRKNQERSKQEQVVEETVNLQCELVQQAGLAVYTRDDFYFKIAKAKLNLHIEQHRDILDKNPVELSAYVEKKRNEAEQNFARLDQLARELHIFVKHWNWDSSASLDLIKDLNPKELKLLEKIYYSNYSRNLSDDFINELNKLDHQRFFCLLQGDKLAFYAIEALQLVKNDAESYTKLFLANNERSLLKIVDALKTPEEKEQFLKVFKKHAEENAVLSLNPNHSNRNKYLKDFLEIVGDNYDKNFSAIISSAFKENPEKINIEIEAKKLYSFVNEYNLNNIEIWKYLEQIKNRDVKNASSNFLKLQNEYKALGGAEIKDACPIFESFKDTLNLSEIYYARSKILFAINNKDLEMLREVLLSSKEDENKQKAFNLELQALILNTQTPIFEMINKNFSEKEEYLVRHYLLEGKENESSRLLSLFCKESSPRTRREILNILESSDVEQINNLENGIRKIFEKSHWYHNISLKDLSSKYFQGTELSDFETALKGKPTTFEAITARAAEELHTKVHSVHYLTDKELFEKTYYDLLYCKSGKVGFNDLSSNLAYRIFRNEGYYYSKSKEERAELSATILSTVLITTVTISTGGAASTFLLATCGYAASDFTARWVSNTFILGNEYSYLKFYKDIQYSISHSLGFSVGGRLSQAMIHRLIGAKQLEQIVAEALKQKFVYQILENTADNAIGGAVASMCLGIDELAGKNDKIGFDQRFKTFLLNAAREAGINAAGAIILTPIFRTVFGPMIRHQTPIFDNEILKAKNRYFELVLKGDKRLADLEIKILSESYPGIDKQFKEMFENDLISADLGLSSITRVIDRNLRWDVHTLFRFENNSLVNDLIYSLVNRDKKRVGGILSSSLDGNFVVEVSKDLNFLKFQKNYVELGYSLDEYLEILENIGIKNNEFIKFVNVLDTQKQKDILDYFFSREATGLDGKAWDEACCLLVNDYLQRHKYGKAELLIRKFCHSREEAINDYGYSLGVIKELFLHVSRLVNKQCELREVDDFLNRFKTKGMNTVLRDPFAVNLLPEVLDYKNSIFAKLFGQYAWRIDAKLLQYYGLDSLDLDRAKVAYFEQLISKNEYLLADKLSSHIEGLLERSKSGVCYEHVVTKLDNFFHHFNNGRSYLADTELSFLRQFLDVMKLSLAERQRLEKVTAERLLKELIMTTETSVRALNLKGYIKGFFRETNFEVVRKTFFELLEELKKNSNDSGYQIAHSHSSWVKGL